MALIFSILGILGAGGVIGAVNLMLKLEAKSAVEEAFPVINQTISESVTEAVGASLAKLDRDISLEREMQNLSLIGDALENDTPMDDELMRSVFRSLHVLAGNDERLSEQRFSTAMAKIINSLALRNDIGEIDQIDSLVGQYLARNPSASVTLCNHYGELVIGSPYPVDRMAAEVARLERYLKTARNEGFPEVALMWEIFLEFKRNDYAPASVIDNLVESAADLNEKDAAIFYNNIADYSDWENWLNVETQQGRELERLVAALLQAYPKLGVAMEPGSDFET